MSFRDFINLKPLKIKQSFHIIAII